jgi:DNA helicase IV
MAKEPESEREREIAEEQAVLNVIAAIREQLREHGLKPHDSAANPADNEALRRALRNASEHLKGPNEPVAFGRIDIRNGSGASDKEDTITFRIGRQAIAMEATQYVIDWRTPIAQPFYTATPNDPMGLSLKREYRPNGKTNRLDRLVDTDFRALAESLKALESDTSQVLEAERLGADTDVSPVILSDTLREELERGRGAAMQDIVQTIQAKQYDIIREPLEVLLIIQGGAGTGKTAVALHRVSWLLFNHSRILSPQDVLVVGPTAAFTAYTREVLPGLGSHDVKETYVHALSNHPHIGGQESDEVAKVKGSAGMEEFLRRALAARSSPAEQDLKVRLDHQIVTIRRDRALKLLSVDPGRPSESTPSNAVERLVDEVRRSINGTPPPSLEQLVEKALESFRPTKLTAEKFVRDLYSSREQLEAATGDHLTAQQAALLHRPVDSGWTTADIAVLDCTEYLINGLDGSRYKHIVIDEAQDLSPMELKMIGRRSSRNGSMTVLGDLAQSTGIWARDSWDEVIEHLPRSAPVIKRELRFGYRVPSQAFALAAKLLAEAAPGITPPRAVRPGPDPLLLECAPGELASAAATQARDFAEQGSFVGVICSENMIEAVRSALSQPDVERSNDADGQLGGSINLMTPVQAKGLEFDAVVVVEPLAIVQGSRRGLRLLYVSLTRTTKHLAVIHSGVVLPLTDVRVQAVIDNVVPAIRDGIEPELWPRVLDGVRAALANAKRPHNG